MTSWNDLSLPHCILIARASVFVRRYKNIFNAEGPGVITDKQSPAVPRSILHIAERLGCCSIDGASARRLLLSNSRRYREVSMNGECQTRKGITFQCGLARASYGFEGRDLTGLKELACSFLEQKVRDGGKIFTICDLA